MNALIEAVTLPLQFPFMRDAVLIALLIAPAAAILSCFLVLKGWALMGDATSHAVLPGVVLAWVAGLPPLVGAFGAGLACAWAVGAIQTRSRVRPDTVMGVVFSGMFGLGIVLHAALDTGLHLDQILFGNMLGVSAQDLWISGLIAGAVALGLIAWRRDLLAASFDPVQARAIGLPVEALRWGLLIAISATVVAMLSSVGIILAVAYLIAPGAFGFLMARRFGAMLAWAVAATAGAGAAGVIASFWLDSAPAPTIVLILTGLVGLALARRSLSVARRARRV